MRLCGREMRQLMQSTKVLVGFVKAQDILSMLRASYKFSIAWGGLRQSPQVNGRHLWQRLMPDQRLTRLLQAQMWLDLTTIVLRLGSRGRPS